MHTRRALTLIAASASLVLAGCGGGASSGTKNDSGLFHIRYMLANSTISLGHTQLAVAQARGYYKKAGLSVDFVTNSNGTGATPQGLANGTANIVMTDTLGIDQSLEKGITDIRSVCAYVADNIYYLVVPRDSPIHSVADLKGKNIAVSSLSAGVALSAKVALEQAGVDPGDVNFVAIAQLGAELHALTSGQVDALSFVDYNVGVLENQGVDVRVFRPTGPSKWQFTVNAVSTSFLTQHPREVAGFCRATLQGELFAKTNPQAALEDFKKEGNDVGGLTDEQAVGVIKARADTGFVTYPRAQNKWGWQNVGAMRSLGDLYHEQGLLQHEPDVNDVYTNQLLDQMQFDEQSVIDQAKHS